MLTLQGRNVITCGGDNFSSPVSESVTRIFMMLAANTVTMDGEHLGTMASTRLSGYLTRVRRAVRASLTEDYTPHQVASSFAVGTFICMLPTLGVGLALFFVLSFVFRWMNKLALFASAAIFNPLLKTGVWVISLAIGFLVLGPVDGFAIGDVPTLQDGSAIVLRLVFGSFVLAVPTAIIAYFVMYRVVVAYERKELPVLEGAVEGVVQEIDAEEAEKRESRP